MTEQVPFRPVRLDLSLDDARPRSARIPEGYYLLECDGYEAPTQTKTSTGARALFHVVAGPDLNPNQGLGARLNDYNTIETPTKEHANFPISVTLVALGRGDIVEAFAKMSAQQQTSTSMAHLTQVFQRISSVIKGLQCVGDIRDSVGTRETFSNIQALLPKEDWALLKKGAQGGSGPTGSPVPVMPSGPNGPTAGSDLFADLERTI